MFTYFSLTFTMNCAHIVYPFWFIQTEVVFRVIYECHWEKNIFSNSLLTFAVHQFKTNVVYLFWFTQAEVLALCVIPEHF